MTINDVINSKSLNELVCAVEEFCRENLVRGNDDVCMELIEKLELIKGNDYLMLLSSYIIAAEDGDEVIEALYEFIANCKGFVEADEEMTQQVTKEEFEAVLDECQEKCGLLDCIKEERTLNIIEIPYYNSEREVCTQLRNKIVNIILPKIDINKTVKEYIAERIGAILYDVLLSNWSDKYIRAEINRYIPETRSQANTTTKELFKKYFYSVVLYKERSPGIYPEFDEHMQRVLILEFFRHIIKHCSYQQEDNDNKKE